MARIFFSVLCFTGCCLILSYAAPANLKTQEIFVETEISVLPTCNCTTNSSKYCTLEGTCSSAKVGRALKKSFAKIKGMMELLGEFPGDRPRREMRDNLCGRLEEMEEMVDLMLIDFEDWEPVCARIIRNDLEIHTCSLAPKESVTGKLQNEEINTRIHKLYKYLGCKNIDKMPKFVAGDFHYCRTGDFCNTESLIDELPVELPVELLQRRVEDSETAGFSTMQILLYFIVPLIVFLILFLAIAMLVYSRPGAWSYVFPVAKITEKNLPQ